MNKMEGMARIEIANTKTGKKKVIEEHNIVTDAFSKFVKFGINNFAAQAISPDKVGSQSIFPINAGGMTGILLLPSQQIESSSNIFVPEELSPIGASSYKRTTSAAGIYGTNNQNESQVINNDDGTFTWKYVTDFDTNQANGTTNCICLVPNGIPPIGLGRITDLGITNSFTRTNYNLSSDVWQTILPVYIDYTNDCFYTLRNYSDGSNRYLSLYKHPLYMKTVDAGVGMYNQYFYGNNAYLYPAPIGKLVKMFQPTGMTSMMYVQTKATSNGKLYLTLSTGPSASVANGSSFILIEIDMQNGYVVKEHTITNNTGVNLVYFSSVNQAAYTCYPAAFTGFFVDGDYIYLRNYVTSNDNATMYRIKISDSTWTNLGLFRYLPVCAFGDYIYGYYGAIHRKTGAITTKTYGVGEQPSSYVSNMIPVYGTDEMLFYRFYSIDIGNCLGWYSYYSMPYNVLMTINNLSTPLVKTTDDTMKITYMITWSI